MATKAATLLNAQPVPGDWTQSREDWLDLGAYKQLNVLFEILSTGSGGSVKVQHAAIPEDGNFVDITGMSSDTGTAGADFKTTEAFLRYIRVVSTSGLTGSPVVAIRVVAKE